MQKIIFIFIALSTAVASAGVYRIQKSNPATVSIPKMELKISSALCGNGMCYYYDHTNRFEFSIKESTLSLKFCFKDQNDFPKSAGTAFREFALALVSASSGDVFLYSNKSCSIQIIDVVTTDNSDPAGCEEPKFFVKPQIVPCP